MQRLLPQRCFYQFASVRKFSCGHLLCRPPTKSEADVEQADVGEAGFPQQGLVLLGRKHRQPGANGGRGLSGLGWLYARRNGKGGVAGQPLRARRLCLGKAVVGDHQRGPRFELLIELAQRTLPFCQRQEVQGEQAGRRIEWSRWSRVNIPFVQPHPRQERPERSLDR